MLEVALKYHARGWVVIPVHKLVKDQCTCGRENCPTPGKHPRIAWTPFTKERPSARQVKEWFGDEFYGSNIGLVTGSVSDLAIVDFDNGMLPKRSELKGHLDFHTLAVRTGGGGIHLYYKLGKESIQSRIRAWPGIDIKAEGGFVVMPPSRHRSGRCYEWMNELEPMATDLSILKQRSGNGTTFEDGDRHWYVQVLDGVEEGLRSNTVARLSGRYATIGLQPKEAFYLLLKWNEHNVPPMDVRDVKKSMLAVYRKHRDNTEPEAVRTMADIERIMKRRKDEANGD